MLYAVMTEYVHLFLTIFHEQLMAVTQDTIRDQLYCIDINTEVRDMFHIYFIYVLTYLYNVLFLYSYII